MGYNSLLINEDAVNTANELNSYPEYQDIKGVVTANYIAYRLAVDFFGKNGFNVGRGISTSAKVIRDLNICDVYVDGNYIDVRLYFEDNEMCIPSKAFDKGIKPSLYMFIKIAEDLKEASVTGFIAPENIQISTKNTDNYPVSLNSLSDFEDVQDKLVQKEYISYLPNGFERQMIDYFDDKLTDCNDFYSELINSELARSKFIEYLHTKNLLSVTNFDMQDFETSEEDEQTNETEVFGGEADNMLLEDYPQDDFSLLSEETSGLLYENNVEPDLNVNDTYLLPDDNNLEISENITTDTLDEVDIGFTNVEEQGLTEDVADMDDADEISMQNDNLMQTEAPQEVFIPNESYEMENLEINDFQSDIKETEKQKQEEDEEELLQLFSDEEPTEITETIRVTEQDEVSPEVQQGNIQNNEIDEIAESVAGLYEQVPVPNNIDENGQIDEDEQDYSTVIEENLTDTDFQEQPDISEISDYENNYMTDDLNENWAQPQQTKKKGSPLIPLLLIVLIAAGGFFGYTKFTQMHQQTETQTAEIPQSSDVQTKTENIPASDMPVETVDNDLPKDNTAELGNNAAVPKIESNLNVSIAVSNLKVSWEVPNAYLTNQAIKRYFNRIGRIIQLNLKTELLLLSKPPITNKIAVELELNKNSNVFEIKGITVSSGEEEVDNIVKTTVKTVLSKQSIKELSALKNIKGNPVLVIHL